MYFLHSVSKASHTVAPGRIFKGLPQSSLSLFGRFNIRTLTSKPKAGEIDESLTARNMNTDEKVQSELTVSTDTYVARRTIYGRDKKKAIQAFRQKVVRKEAHQERKRAKLKEERPSIISQTTKIPWQTKIPALEKRKTRRTFAPELSCKHRAMSFQGIRFHALERESTKWITDVNVEREAKYWFPKRGSIRVGMRHTKKKVNISLFNHSNLDLFVQVANDFGSKLVTTKREEQFATFLLVGNEKDVDSTIKVFAFLEELDRLTDSHAMQRTQNNFTVGTLKKMVKEAGKEIAYRRMRRSTNRLSNVSDADFVIEVELKSLLRKLSKGLTELRWENKILKDDIDFVLSHIGTITESSINTSQKRLQGEIRV